MGTKQKIFLLTLSIIMLVFGCKKNTPGNSLVINNDTMLNWKYASGGPIYYSSPAIDNSGTIYFATGAPFASASASRSVFAINANGTLKWKYDVGINMYTPALGADGTVYIQDALCKLYALSSTGALKWTFSLSNQSNVGQTSPAIGNDGTIYVGADALYAINPDGTLKWKNSFSGGINDLNAIDYIRSSPAIASDGTIYVGATGTFAHCPGACIVGGALFTAVNPDGTSKWNHSFKGTNAIFSSPAIGSDGTIYFGAETSTSGYVYALNPDGTQKWRYTTNNTVRSSPAIGADGTIYIGTKSYLGTKTATSTNAEFLALNQDGTLKWKYSIDVDAADIYCSPTIGANGIIYFGAETSYLYAMNPDGTLAWKYNTNNGINWTSATIKSDGTLYIGNNNGELFSIKSKSFGLANSVWPKFRRNNSNTGKY